MDAMPWYERWLRELAHLQARHPGRVLLVVLALTLINLALAVQLRLFTGFESLLPRDRPSVRELERVSQKTAGVSTIFVVLHANDGPEDPAPTEAMRRAADTVAHELRNLGLPWIGSAEANVKGAISFLEPRAGLYVELETLEDLRTQIDARLAYEVNRELGVLLEDEPPPALSIASIKKRLGIDESIADRYPGGYYQSKDGKTIVVAARSRIMGSDLELGTEALERIRAAIERAQITSIHPSIRYGLAGDLYSGVAELSAIRADLTQVGIVGILLISGVVFLFYLRVRTLLVLLVTISAGVIWTFGLTYIAIGHLNLATGFLFTIIAGNGINTGLIYMARYLEARRGGASRVEGFILAHHDTARATITAAAAAGAAYGSLLVTDFRGFRDFGVIGGVGMLLCWIATVITLPALLSLIERFAPLSAEVPGVLARLRKGWGAAFGRPLAALVPLAPRTITITGVALSIAGLVGVVYYLQSDPFEYDMSKLRNEMAEDREDERNRKLAEELTGYVGMDAMAILVDRPEQVKPLRKALYEKRDAAPAEQKPFKDIHALSDFVPEKQAEKMPVLLDIKHKILRARRRGLIDDQNFAKIEPYLPPDDIESFSIDDLPTAIARPFTETDGTRGRIVYISPSGNAEDARYLFRWADSYRRTVLPDGSVILGSGRAVIYADMWEAVLEAVPKVVAASLLATVMVVAAAFHSTLLSAMVVGALLIGVSWLIGFFVLFEIKLNFMNFIALPITFGIGVDYAVNIAERYRREGHGGALTALRETGGAVILCSMTTILGYLALIGSMNYAVKSLGIAAVLGEACCLFAAVLVLPAGLLWLERRRTRPPPTE